MIEGEPAGLEGEESKDNTRTGGNYALYQEGSQRYQDETTTDSEFSQDDFRLDQDEIMTKTAAMGGIETEGWTGRGDFEFGQDGFVIMADTLANRPQCARSATDKYQTGHH